MELASFASEAKEKILIDYLCQSHSHLKPELLLLAFLITHQCAFLGKNWGRIFLCGSFNVAKFLIRELLSYLKRVVSEPQVVLKIFQEGLLGKQTQGFLVRSFKLK